MSVYFAAAISFLTITAAETIKAMIRPSSIVHPYYILGKTED